MKNTGEEYETFVTTLIEGVVRSGRDIHDDCAGKSNTITGAAGQPHQIDVSFIDESFPKSTLVLVSCKDINKNVEPLHMKEWIFNVLDIFIALQGNLDAPDDVKGMIVTGRGFSRGAKRLAEYYNITTELAEDPANYTFSYENIVQVGNTEGVKLGDTLTATVDKPGDRGPKEGS